MLIRALKYLFFIPLFLVLLNCNKKNQTMEQFAIVLNYSGKVSITSAKGEAKNVIQLEEKVLPTDTIQTFADSSILLLLPRTSEQSVTVHLFPNTKIQVASLIEPSNELKTNNYNIRLYSGKAYIDTHGKLDSRESLSIVSESYNAGVRGTDFIVSEDDSLHGVLVQSGEVEVIRDSQQASATAGQSGSVSEDGKISITPLRESEIQLLQTYKLNTEQILTTHANEVQKIQSTHEIQKQEILKSLDEQKSKNNQIIKEQKDNDGKLLQDQKDKNSSMIQQEKTSQTDNLDKAKDSNKSQLQLAKEKAKSDASSTLSESQKALQEEKAKADSLREEMNRLKNPSKQ
jgi:hypothetical protein